MSTLHVCIQLEYTDIESIQSITRLWTSGNLFSRNIGYVTPKIRYFRCLWKENLHQSIQKIHYLILITEALMNNMLIPFPHTCSWAKLSCQPANSLRQTLHPQRRRADSVCVMHSCWRCHFWLFVLADGPQCQKLYTYVIYHLYALCIHTTICMFGGPPAMSKTACQQLWCDVQVSVAAAEGTMITAVRTTKLHTHSCSHSTAFWRMLLGSLKGFKSFYAILCLLWTALSHMTK